MIHVMGVQKVLVIAGQKDLEYLYAITPHVWLELLDEYNNGTEDRQIGNVVVTRLDGYFNAINQI